jgi:hypothetical protein
MGWARVGEGKGEGGIRTTTKESMVFLPIIFLLYYISCPLYNHARIEPTATVGLQAKTALAMPDCPAHRKREFSPNIFS